MHANDWYWTELLVLHKDAWNPLNVCMQMNVIELNY